VHEKSLSLLYILLNWSPINSVEECFKNINCSTQQLTNIGFMSEMSGKQMQL